MEYFDTLESVNQKQEELNNCIRDGFLLMAKVGTHMFIMTRKGDENIALIVLFTHSDPVSYPVPVTVKFYNCVIGDGPSDGQNEFQTHSARHY